MVATSIENNSFVIRTVVANNDRTEYDEVDKNETLQSNGNASTAIIAMRQEKQNVMENYDHYLKQNLQYRKQIRYQNQKNSVGSAAPNKNLTSGVKSASGHHQVQGSYRDQS